MKRPIMLAFLLMIFIFLNTFSQSWDLVQTNRTSFYKKPDGQYFVINWANAAPPNYKPYSVFWNETGYINDTSWIGSTVVKKLNGDQIFVNCKGDSLLIKTKTNINEPWVFSSGFNATITAIINKSILGIEDSVKLIKIKSFDGIDSTEIQICKNFGFVLVPILKYFPLSLGEFNLTLSGIQRLAGFQNLSDSTFYNFNAGDEFEILNTGASYSCQPPTIGTFSRYQFIKVIQKQTQLGIM